MPSWRLHAPRNAGPSLLLALGLLLPLAASAQDIPSASSTLTAMAWSGSATPASFSDVATTEPTISTALLASPTPPTEQNVSAWWLALPLPGLAAWALRRRRPHRPASDEDNDTAPNGWAITRWMQGAHSDARGWRLSRFEELAEPDFTPLYGSLDDPDLPATDNVVPLHRSPEMQATKRRRAYANHHKTDVIDIEARLIAKGP